MASFFLYEPLLLGASIDAKLVTAVAKENDNEVKGEGNQQCYSGTELPALIRWRLCPPRFGIAYP